MAHGHLVADGGADVGDGAVVRGGEGELHLHGLDGAEPLYRLRHANGDHFYTVSAPERDSAIGLGYTLVGTIGYVFRAP